MTGTGSEQAVASLLCSFWEKALSCMIHNSKISRLDFDERNLVVFIFAFSQKCSLFDENKMTEIRINAVIEHQNSLTTFTLGATFSFTIPIELKNRIT